jgi:hypothetical protein
VHVVLARLERHEALVLGQALLEHLARQVAQARLALQALEQQRALVLAQRRVA